MDAIQGVPVRVGYRIGSIIFILGLIWSYRMVEKTFLDILITRLTKVWKVYDPQRSAAVVNLHDVVTITFVMVFSYLTDVNRDRLRRFRMVVISTAVCIVGLILNYVAAAAGTDKKGQLYLWVLCPALLLMAFAQAGHRVTLKVFLEDQFRHQVDNNEDERRRYTKFWWILVSLVATIFAQLETLTGFDFKTLALSLIIAMLCFGAVFFFGFNNYNEDYPGNNDGEATNNDINWRMRIILFSWWACLSIFGLVSASGRTFFFLEAITLAHRDNLFAILVLANLVRCVEILISEASRLAVKQLTERHRYDKPNMEVMRMGVGVFSCMFCCNCAVATAVQRKDDTGSTSTMSVYWLIPQFILLGMMRGSAKGVFQSLYESKVQYRFKKYGRPLGVLTKGVGSLLSIFCVYILGGKQFKWFQSDLDNCSLDKYYNFLSALSMYNAVLYLGVLVWYIGPWFLLEDRYVIAAYNDHRE